jgi:hypothetical protein
LLPVTTVPTFNHIQGIWLPWAWLNAWELLWYAGSAYLSKTLEIHRCVSLPCSQNCNYICKLKMIKSECIDPGSQIARVFLSHLHAPFSFWNSSSNPSWSKLEVELVAVITGINIHYKFCCELVFCDWCYCVFKTLARLLALLN